MSGAQGSRARVPVRTTEDILQDPALQLSLRQERYSDNRMQGSVLPHDLRSFIPTSSRHDQSSVFSLVLFEEGDFIVEAIPRDAI